MQPFFSAKNYWPISWELYFYVKYAIDSLSVYFILYFVLMLFITYTF